MESIEHVTLIEPTRARAFLSELQAQLRLPLITVGTYITGGSPAGVMAVKFGGTKLMIVAKHRVKESPPNSQSAYCLPVTRYDIRFRQLQVRRSTTSNVGKLPGT